MAELLTPVAAVALFVFLVVLNIRRRARMSPEQRAIEDLQRRTRRIEREQRRARID